MSDEKKPTRRVTRVALRLETEETLEKWRTQLQEVYAHFAPSDRELVEWAIERTSSLSKKEMSEIKSRYFDDVSELEALVSQLKEAKASGDQQSVCDLLATVSLRRKAVTSNYSNGSEDDSLAK